MRCDLLCGPQKERIIDVKLLVQKRRETRERDQSEG